MVAIPIAHDQPTIAQRIVWTGTGTLVGLDRLNVDTLRGAIGEVMTDSRYREAAHGLRQKIEMRGGLERAADLVEMAMGRGQRQEATAPAHTGTDSLTVAAQ
jgi:UDP:flavonoid glycosyltransferase YjiC (YdhE family)